MPLNKETKLTPEGVTKNQISISSCVNTLNGVCRTKANVKDKLILTTKKLFINVRISPVTMFLATKRCATSR